jgi:hypothetical protein
VRFVAITLCVASLTSNTKGKCIFLYRLSPETFAYALLFIVSFSAQIHINYLAENASLNKVSQEVSNLIQN